MKKALLIFCTLVVVFVLILPFLPVNGEERIYDEVIRLHVLANSDSSSDQALKLKVRDKILEMVKEFSDTVSTKKEAIKNIVSNIDNMKAAARECIAKEGFAFPVEITLTEEYYPTREYEGVSMPKGKYLSLRVLIGKAKGQNWWCVLYPPLCTSCAEPKQTLKEAGFTSSQIKVLTEGEKPKYRIRFRILEFFEELFG